jgi:hypothetical protein
VCEIYNDDYPIDLKILYRNNESGLLIQFPVQNPVANNLVPQLQNLVFEPPPPPPDNGALININPDDQMDGGMTGQELLDLPVTGWPGSCAICYGDDNTDLCRVDCRAGHIFHCGCIDQWRNARDYNGRRNRRCPLCRDIITYKISVPDNMAERLPSGFGKRKSKMSPEEKYLRSFI